MATVIDPADPLAQWWVHTTLVSRYLGQGAEGETWTDPEPEPCFVDAKVRYVPGPTGVQVLSQATVRYPKATPNIPEGSTVKLPAEFGGDDATVVAMARHDGGGLPTPDHLEVSLA